MLHGSNPASFDLCVVLGEVEALTRMFLRFLGFLKETIGTLGIASLQLSEVWRMGKNVWRIEAMLGRAGLYVTTKGILFCFLSGFFRFKA